MKKSAGQQATRRRGESWGESAGGFGGYDSASKHAREWRVVAVSGIGVDVDVEEVFAGLVEVELPERRKWERNGG